MPGFTTHLWHESIQSCRSHHKTRLSGSCQLGLQGPDMFFYNIRRRAHDCATSVCVRTTKVTPARGAACAVLEPSARANCWEEAISYLAGFINHYIADSICHRRVMKNQSSGYLRRRRSRMRIGKEMEAPTRSPAECKKKAVGYEAFTIHITNDVNPEIYSHFWLHHQRNLSILLQQHRIYSGDGAPLHLGAALRLPDTLQTKQQEKNSAYAGQNHLRQPPSCFRENGNGLRNRLPEQL